MLLIVCLTAVLQETNTIVSFATREGNRVDISKRLIKKAPDSSTWYFTKGSKVYTSTTMPVYLDKVYVIAVADTKIAFGADGNPIVTAQDLIAFDEVAAYNKARSSIKELPHLPW